jgi:Polyketide cyclase / dehydrase and lipid transport
MVRPSSSLHVARAPALAAIAAIAFGAAGSLGCALQRAPSPKAANDHVAPSAPAGAPEASREAAVGDDPVVDSVPVRGSSIERARASVGVSAPLSRVRETIFDFAHYPDFMPHYDRATELGPTAGGGRLVQMDITEMGGLIHLGLQAEIAAPRLENGAETYDGRLVKGNVKAFQWRWRLEPISAGRTKVTVESFIDPDMALVPTSLLNRGARDGVRDGVLAIKARSEGR